jgi:putative ABC transport system ATP-binding protein
METSQTNTIIEINDLHRIYESQAGAVSALRGVSFKVERAEFVAIMGPSGSGKSTLMNIMGCLDRPTIGQYILAGTDISTMDDNDLADLRATTIGFVFQSFNLLPRASVLRNVMLPLVYTACPHREREERARTALTAVGLEERFFEHMSNELSGGQMQRVAIARALVNNPELILADEPTGNLDTATGEMVLQTLKVLRDQQRTIVLITHDEEVASHADRVLYLRDGLFVNQWRNSRSGVSGRTQASEPSKQTQSQEQDGQAWLSQHNSDSGLSEAGATGSVPLVLETVNPVPIQSSPQSHQTTVPLVHPISEEQESD